MRFLAAQKIKQNKFWRWNMNSENTQFQQQAINLNQTPNHLVLGGWQQIISTQGEEINGTNAMDKSRELVWEIWSGRPSSVVLDDLRNAEALSDRYCELDYKKLSGEKLTEEEKLFLAEIDRQFEDYPSAFAMDQKYAAAKKELEKLREQSE